MMRHLIDSWNKLAEDDPLWAILTASDKAGARWNEDEFFATGIADVEAVWARLSELNLLPATHRALDFGCGVGRLTRALAARFSAVDGVDVSSTMIQKARQIRAVPNHVEFLHNPRPDLALLHNRRYSFILSLISLQHVPGRIALRYVSDMMDRLEPRGVAYLQLSTFLDASHPPAAQKLRRDESFLNRGYRAVREVLQRKPPRMDTHYCRLSDILFALERRRMRLVAVLPDASLPAPFISHILVIQRPG